MQWQEKVDTAQQRVAELEREAADLQDRLQDAQRCIAVMETQNDQLRRLTDRHDRDYAEAQKQVDRLRELLREIREFCCDSQLVALIPIIRKIDKAELAKGE